jgi:small neutral amino acid transporter SnatA (MarC family)
MSEDTFMGVKSATALFSFIGAAGSLSYAKDLTRTQALSALAIGTMVAVSGAPLVMQWLGSSWPDTMERFIGFFMGLVAMRLVPAVLSAVDALKTLRTPWNKGE